MFNPYIYKAKIVRVIDCDTLDVDIDLGFRITMENSRIRLYGIDGPEIRTTDPVEKKQGQLSKSVMERMCPVGSIVYIKTDIHSDKFGRTLATIYNHNRININEYLIEHKYAVPYNGENKAQIEDLHLSNRQFLIENGELEDGDIQT